MHISKIEVDTQNLFFKFNFNLISLAKKFLNKLKIYKKNQIPTPCQTHSLVPPKKEEKYSQNYRGLKSLLHFLFTFIAGTKRRGENFQGLEVKSEHTTTIKLRIIQRRI